MDARHVQAIHPLRQTSHMAFLRDVGECQHRGAEGEEQRGVGGTPMNSQPRWADLKVGPYGRLVIPVDEPRVDIASQVADCVPGSVSVADVKETLVLEKFTSSNTPAISKMETTAKPSDDDKKRAMYKRKKG